MGYWFFSQFFLMAALFALCGCAVFLFFDYYPVYALVVFGFLILWGFIKFQMVLRRDKERGWRVGPCGRDDIYYEEWCNGKWRRIIISGDMLVGKPHRVIYISSRRKWQQYPEWAQSRRDEIIKRIKSEFREPNYKYDGD